MAGKKKPLVVITRKLPDPVETRMRELFDARLNIDDKPMSRDELMAAMQEADVLVPTITDRIDEALIAGAGENLKLIANFGNGVDQIDVAAAGKKGIAVTNTPNVLTEDTADMTMGLILTVPRRLIEGANTLADNGKWAGWSPTWMLGRRIWGKRLGIVGMGRIGTAVARRAKAFGLSIHYHNRKRVMAAGRGRAGGDLLGKPRPDAGAHGHHFGQLPVDAGDLPSAVGAAAGAAAALGLHRQHGARRHHRRGRADQADPGRQGRRAPGSTCSSTSRRSTRSS